MNERTSVRNAACSALSAQSMEPSVVAMCCGPYSTSTPRLTTGDVHSVTASNARGVRGG